MTPPHSKEDALMDAEVREKIHLEILKRTGAYHANDHILLPSGYHTGEYIEIVRRIRQTQPHCACIVMTAYASTESAVEALLDKRLTGFGELFRMLSYQEIGPAAMLSRAQGGVVQGRVLFSLPGSPNACRLALESLIIPELGHLIREVNR